MSLQDVPSQQHAGRDWRPTWSAVREEAWEIIWLVAIVSTLSLTSVAVAIVLAGA
jgi:hypothetical protein